MRGPIKTIFCGIETVSCVTGLSVDRLYELVDSGNYLWVWNVSIRVGSRRELRFWCREINHPSAVVNFTLNSAIDALIPKRAHVADQRDGLYNWEFRNLLRISKPTVWGLREEIGVTSVDNDLFIPRARLDDFFRRRWLGNIIIRNCNLQPDLAPRLAHKLCA